MPPRHRPPVLRGIASLLLLVQLAACTSWRAQSRPPGDLVVGEQPKRVRVTYGDGSVATLEDASVTGDSLIGLSRAAGQRVAPRRTAIALADITRIELSKFSTRRTLLLVGIPVALYAILSVIALSRPDLLSCASPQPCQWDAR